MLKKKQCSKFVLSKFLTSTIAFGVLHTSLICCVLIPFFKDSGMLPLQISIIIISKRVLRLFCDTIFGIAFDRFGPKIVFISGRLLKLSSYIIMLFFPNFYGFIIAMLLDGASYSSIYGKISSYIYNNLSIKRKLKVFPQAMSIYYLCMDASIAMMSFFAGILLKVYNYNFLIYASIITNLFSVIILIKYVPSTNDIRLKKFKAKSMSNIFLKVKHILKMNKQIRYLMLFYGINSFLAWQFHSISSMILLDMKLSGSNLAICGGILKIIMGIGAIISIFFFKNGLSIKKCSLFILISLGVGVISACLYKYQFFYFFCLLITISYTTIEVSIEKSFDFQSDKTIRGTIISLAMTFCSFLAIISNIIVGIIAQCINYQIGLISLLITFLLIVFYLQKKFN